jgi:hypothetical protein
MVLSHNSVFALREWTVEKRAKGWYFWKTYGGRDEAKGPYSSEVSVCLMIARELRMELLKRNAPAPPAEAAA